MKRFFERLGQFGTTAFIFSLVLGLGCVSTPPAPPPFEDPKSWSEMQARADAAGCSTCEGYMWALGSGDEVDQCSKVNKYSCFAIVHGTQRQFPCPCGEVPTKMLR